SARQHVAFHKYLATDEAAQTPELRLLAAIDAKSLGFSLADPLAIGLRHLMKMPAAIHVASCRSCATAFVCTSPTRFPFLIPPPRAGSLLFSSIAQDSCSCFYEGRSVSHLSQPPGLPPITQNQHAVRASRKNRFD